MRVYYNKHTEADPFHYIIRTKPDEEILTGWYWWDEQWGKRFGPYETYDQAREANAKYAEEL